MSIILICMNCKYCNVETHRTGGTHSNHVAWCTENPNRSKRAAALSKVRAARNGLPGANQHTKARQEGRQVEVSQETREKISLAVRGRQHTSDTRKLLSDVRKKWLTENPDQHPWKKNSKFKSVPCEVLKEKLRAAGLKFEEEYTPLQDRAFAVDIAFPEVRLAVEVNGEQHYNRDGTLKSYYRERHELIEKSGWSVIELHYARCYDPHLEETIKQISEKLYPRMPPAF